MLRFLVGFVSFHLVLALLAGATNAQSRLSVEGTEFVLRPASGETMRSLDLVGAVVEVGEAGNTVSITIERVEESRGAKGGKVFLHHFSTTDAAGVESALCIPDAEGRSLGFPVDNGHGGMDIVCTSGAIGKCILWGYRSWEETEAGPPLRLLHKACVNMVRADYGGDGSTYTRDGTRIAFCDRYGIHRCDAGLSFSFEAAWSAKGATCLARPRIPALASASRLAERYPQLSGRVGPAICNARTAFANADAVLISHSVVPAAE